MGGRPSTQVNRDGSLLTFLDTLKNLLVGKIRHPHTHMINYGIQAITFEAIYNEKFEKKLKKSGDSFQHESGRIPKLMSVLEKLLRIFDQLDEQLHAGFYFYLVIGTKKFISNNEYMYPAALLFAGILIPNYFDYFDTSEKQEKDQTEIDSGKKRKNVQKMDQSVTFVGVLYFLCSLFAILPFSLFLLQRKLYGLKEESACHFT